MNKISFVYYRVGEWIINLFLLNLLWIVFSLAGIIVAGVFPATAALFSVMRKLIMVPDEVHSVTKLFWNSYKSDFIRANGLGYFSLLIGLVLFYDYQILERLGTTIFHQSLTIILYIIIFFYLMINIYLFPLFVHFHLGILGYLKYAFILTIAKPLQTLLILLGLALILYLYFELPGLIPVLGVSTFGLLVMKITSFSLQDMKEKEG